MTERSVLSPQPLPPCLWGFPPVETADEHGVVGVGADLAPSTLIAAYRHGMFPMPAGGDSHEDDSGSEQLIAWWSPDPRGVLELDQLVVSRSLRRSMRRYTVTVDRAFDAVIRACATTERPGGWISRPMQDAYRHLHALGWAHSVETWEGGQLVGGLYGVQIGGLFAGESMFHTATDASKVALVELVAQLRSVDASLLDVQWQTDHLATLGVATMSRSEYLSRLARAVEQDVRPIGSPRNVAESHSP